MSRQRIVRPAQVIEVPEVGPDVTVARAGGNLFMVTPVSEKAKTWIEENVEIPDWAWMGRQSFAVDHHLIENLVSGMVAEGLEVE